jgi:uncharacterized protein involved in exopolysaccharide biosynthesis
MVQATEEYYLARVSALEAKVQELESEKAVALLMVSKLEMALQEVRELAQQ